MNEHERDRYFALMVRLCAAMRRGDRETEDSIADALDAIWKLHGNAAEGEWSDACKWINDCIKTEIHQ